MIKRFIIMAILLCGLPESALAQCNILSSDHHPAPHNADALHILLTQNAACPTDVFALRRTLFQAGLKLQTTMVANRGYHNPGLGSFSLFEIVSGNLNSAPITPGDFFFGHFTAIDKDNNLTPDQDPQIGSLMIEAFAWDSDKQVFNFYELRGNGKQGQWFYRGDSADMFADNTFLHRQIDAKHPQFGNRLRCSGCHDAGGPIMKELDAPNNDWWKPKRKLNFGGRKPDPALREILETLVPAERLAASVVAGIKKLNGSGSATANKNNTALTLQEKLRPLFCPLEINFKSDSKPNQDQLAEITIPAEFFIDTRLLPANTPDVVISRKYYTTALQTVGSHFPETELNDADHAWLTPVKATSDKLAVSRLLTHGVIDEKFMADVLAVDMTNPIFSAQRCRLLRLVPDTDTPNWHVTFIKNLAQSNDGSAKQLLENIQHPERTLAYYQQQARKTLQHCRYSLQNSNNVLSMYRLLMQRRIELRDSEISKNPLGQILEPGFRIIFPESIEASVSGKLSLNIACQVLG